MDKRTEVPFLPHDRNLGAIYNASPKIRGPSAKKLGAKNMQNLHGQFHTTSDFDHEYFRNGTRYPKSENVSIECDSSRVPRKSPVNFGPLTTE